MISPAATKESNNSVAPLHSLGSDKSVTIAARTILAALIAPTQWTSIAHSILCIVFIGLICAVSIPIPHLRHPLNLLHMYTDDDTLKCLLFSLLICIMVCTPARAPKGEYLLSPSQRIKGLILGAVLVLTTASACVNSSAAAEGLPSPLPDWTVHLVPSVCVTGLYGLFIFLGAISKND